MNAQINSSESATGRHSGLVLTVLATLLASGAAVSAQTYSIVPIHVPGAGSVAVNALNATGQVAGYFETAAATQHAFRWQAGVATDLGTLGGDNSVANALNNLGQVAGDASTLGNTASHAFLGIGTSLFDLGTLGGNFSSALALSDAGHVVGNAQVSGNSIDAHAFRATPNGSMQDLGTLGGTISSGFAVNNAGQVAGDSSLAGDVDSHAFLFSGGLHDLGTLGGNYSSAADLNESGVVVGESATDLGEIHAFLFNGTSLRDLQTLGGTYSSAFAVNEAGDVMGDSAVGGDTNYHAFIYRNQVLQDLGTLGGHDSSSWSLNNSGQIVGVAGDANDSPRAFVWQNGVMHDLNALLPANSGWVLSAAYFNNDNGQIAGVGTFQGLSTWYLLTPQLVQNNPPVANAGPDQTVGTAGTAVVVNLDGSASTDPDGDALTWLWLEGSTTLATGAQPAVTLGLGAHVLTLRVSDTHGATAEDTVVIQVLDVGSPAVECPGDRTAAADQNGRALVPDLLSGLIASDNATPASALQKTQSPAAGTSLVCGDYPVTITVRDAAGNQTVCTSRFVVRDVTAPVFSSLTADPNVIRQTNRKMVPVTLQAVAVDNCDANPHLQIESVTSNEPVTGHGDNTSPDWNVTGDLTLEVRAEVSAKDTSRVYTIRVSATDAAGNTSFGTVTVEVPTAKMH